MNSRTHTTDLGIRGRLSDDNDEFADTFAGQQTTAGDRKRVFISNKYRRPRSNAAHFAWRITRALDMCRSIR